MKPLHLIVSAVLCLALAGCATATVSPTPLPPTEAPTNPPPTEAPTATATSVPTPTSAPGVIASGEQLGLSADFVELPKDELIRKVPPELVIARVLIEDPKSPFHKSTAVNWLEFPVQASFAFESGDSKAFVYGYTVSLSSPEDQSKFDTTFVQQIYQIEKGTLVYTQGSAPITGLAVGDTSAGMSTMIKIGGGWRFNVISFRVGSTGAFVFTIYPAQAEAPVDIVKLAQSYAATLK